MKLLKFYLLNIHLTSISKCLWGTFKIRQTIDNFAIRTSTQRHTQTLQIIYKITQEILKTFLPPRGLLMFNAASVSLQ